jgi:cobalt-precorrin-5B (C1)-methyltransferase
MARSGYTLPVFAVAAAKAALMHLLSDAPPTEENVRVELLPDTAEISIEQLARLDGDSALAITRSDPGDNLDLTRNTPIWGYVRLLSRQAEPLILEAGEGLGRTLAGDPAIYRYARRLFEANLLPLIPAEHTVRVCIILPAGRQLAERTSNAAFGIVEGLALLGTSGISQPLAVTDSLEAFRQHLQAVAAGSKHLAFCLGSNGRQVASRLGLLDRRVVQTANWIGAMLVEAGLQGVQSVLLIGYHGKLLKLAGGIFNTSSHLADAKLEILSAAALRVGASSDLLKRILEAPTAEAARTLLVEAGLANSTFNNLAAQISDLAKAYVQKYADRSIEIGTVLFDRQGTIVAQDRRAADLLRCHWRNE